MTTKISMNITGSTMIGIAIIYAILAYFVYDRSIDAVVGVFIISIIISLIFLLSLIPIIGWIAALLINYFWAIPWLLEYTGVAYTWVITTMYLLAAIGGLFITIIMCVVIIKITHLKKSKYSRFDRF